MGDLEKIKKVFGNKESIAFLGENCKMKDVFELTQKRLAEVKEELNGDCTYNLTQKGKDITRKSQ